MDNFEDVPEAFRAQWCERNIEAISKIFIPVAKTSKNILEIGSGSAFHAVHIIQELSAKWQCTNIAEAMPALHYWHQRLPSEQLLKPLELDVLNETWPLQQKFDLLYTANTLHIMSEVAVQSLFQKMHFYLNDNAQILIYGPFRENGVFRAQSNADFDARLRSQGIGKGIRDLEWVEELAAKHRFYLAQKTQMPANNLFLLFKNN